MDLFSCIEWTDVNSKCCLLKKGFKIAYLNSFLWICGPGKSLRSFAVMFVINLKQSNKAVCWLDYKLYGSGRESNESNAERSTQTDGPIDHPESEEKHENAMRAAARKGQQEDIGKVSSSLRVWSTACQPWHHCTPWTPTTHTHKPKEALKAVQTTHTHTQYSTKLPKHHTKMCQNIFFRPPQTSPHAVFTV